MTKTRQTSRASEILWHVYLTEITMCCILLIRAIRIYLSIIFEVKRSYVCVCITLVFISIYSYDCTNAVKLWGEPPTPTTPTLREVNIPIYQGLFSV